LDLDAAANNNGGGGDLGSGGTDNLNSEIGVLRDNLQGKLSMDNSNKDASNATIDTGAPPTHWATKQDVTDLSTSGNNDGGGAVNSTTATSLVDRGNNNNTTFAHPLAHPLQDIPTTTAPSSNTATSYNATTFNATPSPTATVSNSTSGNTLGWTTGLSMSNFASFASRAAATVQSAVENAEAAVLHTSSASGGGGQHAPGSQMQQQQQQSTAIASSTVGVVGVQQGGGAPMSYQERQKLLHQQYAANNTTTATVSKQSRQSPPSSVKPAMQPPMGRARQQQPSPTPTVTTQSSTPPTSNNQSVAPSSIPPNTAPSFLEKLTASLDTSTKTKLVSSALGELLPGERVIMFLNSLKDVRDSSFCQVFVGSEDLLLERGLGDVLSGGINNDNGDGGESSNAAGVTTVWCCVMTFYRVAVFSYQATLDGKVLLDEADEGNSSNDTNKEGIISQWLHSQNVSIQFQAAHCPLPSSSTNDQPQTNKQHHYVFQMPLASIERVEKIMASSQKNTMSINPTSNGGYSYNTILPSSSSVSSTASSAMITLGSQMKPLLSGMASNASNSNLLPNGGSSNTNLPTASNPAVVLAGPMGIILHGKDGGRWIQFSASSFGDAQRAQEALNTYAFPGRRNLGYLFAFESRRAEVMASNRVPQNPQGGGRSGNVAEVGAGNPIATAALPTSRRFVPLEEYERQGIFKSRGGGPLGINDGEAAPMTTMTYSSPWAPILNANANYGVCSTYPSMLVGPRSIVGEGDDNNIGLLRRCAAFRSENRFPALTWGSPHDGGSIWRASQPKVGLQGNRSMEDERYLWAIGEEAKRANLAADARDEGGVGGGSIRHSKKAPLDFLRMLCGRNNESDLIMEGNNSSCMLKIMDMRPKSAAMGNRTQGYGYENTNNYRGTTINFYGIGNIHAVR